MEDSEESTMLGPVGGNFYFKRLPDGNLDKTVVLCKLCKKEFAYHRSTSTLRYHLNAKHAASTETVGAVSNSASSPSSSTNKRCRQPNLDEMTGFRTKISKSTSDKLTNSLAKWIALDCRPLSVVEDRGLENVLQLASGDPTFQLPCRKTISNQIQQIYDTEKQAKFDALQKADFVALTGDHWTSVSNSNYIGVTAHIVDDVTDGTWNLQSFVLTVQKTNTRNYAENCAEQFLSVAGEWGIQQKITTIGTDSARSMVVAARHLPFQHMPCVAHILQRTITVSLADSEFSDALAKCRKIVGHFKHSPDNTEELHQEQTRLGQEKEPLIQDVSTRWNSTLDMVSRLLKNQEAVFAALDKQKHKLVILTPSELVKLQKLATVLEPCRFVTELLGGETYVSCSVVLPAFCHLHHTMEVSDDDSNYMVKFKTAFTKDLSQRGATLNHQWLKIATVLDPRFKDLKCLARGEREEVWTSLEALLQEQCKDATTKEPAKTKRLLLSSLSSDSDSDEEVMCNRALNMYRAEATISETDCPLQWWSSRAATHPQLSVLARKYLISPATSVPCERLFSLAGHIVTKKRAALSSENVNRQVCLSNWLKETDNK